MESLSCMKKIEIIARVLNYFESIYISTHRKLKVANIAELFYMASEYIQKNGKSFHNLWLSNAIN